MISFAPASRRRCLTQVKRRILPVLAASLLLIACGLDALPAAAQGAADGGRALINAQGAQSVTAPAGTAFSSSLDGPWRFQVGDDPGWAAASFDDSKWAKVQLSQPATIESAGFSSGYAWYRIHIAPPQSALPLSLLITNEGSSELEVYVNGLEFGRTRGMTDHPVSYWTHPFIVPLAHPAADGGFVVAIRGWGGGSSATGGPLAGVLLGPPAYIADQLDLNNGQLWFKYVLSILLGTLVYLAVAFLGGVLYLTQRHHSEYLWLALLNICLILRGVAEIGGLLAWFSTGTAGVLDNWAASLFIAATLEFMLRFTGSNRRRAVWALQFIALLIPIASLVHQDAAFGVLSATTQVLFALLSVIMMGAAWRRGSRESGVVLLPFLLAIAGNAIANLVNYGVEKGMLPAGFAIHRFYLGPVEFGLGFFTYQIFVASLVAVILYRFIRVSQDEQRNNAEIAAARSVQSLLIPTSLPSTRHFVLESAYLPIGGVGGDFFQVLPLQDHSLLIVVGDVSGKGLQAAMNSSTLVGALRNEIAHDPATVLTHLNRVLIGAVSSPGKLPELDTAPCFATCLCARVYPDGRLVIANAGHLGPYRDGHELELIPSLPLGVVAGVDYEQSTFHLDQGDRLVFLSDGVVEAMNSDGELFGFDRTRQVSNESARYIAQAARHFGQTDDITVLSLYVASRTPQPERQELVRAH